MADTVLRLTPEIIIGLDTINRAGSLFGERGHKILLVTEQGLYENNLIDRLVKVLDDAGLETILFDEIPAQATAEAAETAASLARGARCDLVIGFGSMKTQYIAKLTAILAASTFRLFDLLDGIREESSFIPYAAISATSSDPFLLSDSLIAVDPRDRFVKFVKCPHFICKAIILDPGLSEVGGKLGPATVFDGLCTAMEAYCSSKSSLFSDALLEQAISLYAKMMHSYADNTPADYPGTSVYAGLLMAIGASVSAPGIGTALAYALNGKFPVAKSSCATVLLPYVMEKLIASRPEKMAKTASLIGEVTDGVSVSEAANMAIDTVRSRMGQLQVPARLKNFDLSLDRLVPAAEAARDLEFVASSPWTVTSEDAYDLLKQAF